VNQQLEDEIQLSSSPNDAIITDNGQGEFSLKVVFTMISTQPSEDSIRFSEEQ